MSLYEIGEIDIIDAKSCNSVADEVSLHNNGSDSLCEPQGAGSEDYTQFVESYEGIENFGSGEGLG